MITGMQPAGRGYLVSERKHGTGTWQSPGLQIYYDPSGTMVAYLAGRGGGYKYLAGGGIPVSLFEWHTVRVQWTASTRYLELYLDGVKDTFYDSTENVNETFEHCAGADISLTLGANAYWDGSNEIYTNHLLGVLDNVRIWKGQGGVIPQCGDYGYLASDLNQDCYVDWGDFSIFASEWLGCTDPNPPCNYSPAP